MTVNKILKKIDSLTRCTFAGYPDQAARLAMKAIKLADLKMQLAAMEATG